MQWIESCCTVCLYFSFKKGILPATFCDCSVVLVFWCWSTNISVVLGVLVMLQVSRQRWWEPGSAWLELKEESQLMWWHKTLERFGRQAGTLICCFILRSKQIKKQRYTWLRVFEHTLILHHPWHQGWGPFSDDDGRWHSSLTCAGENESNQKALRRGLSQFWLYSHTWVWNNWCVWKTVCF